MPSAPATPPTTDSHRAEVVAAVANGRLTVAAACEQEGISDRTYYRWQRATAVRRMCTPLAQRLECVRDVESGRLSIRTACEQRGISTRTYYRWLAQKDRIIQLTAAKPDEELNDTHLPDSQPGPSGDQDPMKTESHLPPEKRRHAQPDQPAAPATQTSDPSSGNALDRPTQSLQQAEQQRPQSHQEQNRAQPPADVVINSATKSETAPGASNESSDHKSPVPSGAAPQHPTDGRPSTPNRRYRRRVPPQGASPPAYDQSADQPISTEEIDPPHKHRIVVIHGADRKPIVWYDGALTADIKNIVMRHFKLPAGTFFTLRDHTGLEVTVSPGLPSGMYELLL